MHTIFDAACDAEYREENPAALSRKLLPQQAQTQNHPALPFREVPAALQIVRESTSDEVTKLSFEFLVLTAGRSGEIREARWPEIDLDQALWTIPCERMKARSEHRVPLSTRSVQILHEAWALGGSELVFPNRRSGRPLSNMAFNRLLDRSNMPATTHGFRSSFRTWALEQSNASFEACEVALAHTLGGSGAASPYIRTDLLEERRPLMQSWCDYLKSY